MRPSVLSSLTRSWGMVEIFLVLLLGLSALLGVSAQSSSPVNSCFDPFSTDYKCEFSDADDDGPGELYLSYCGLTDDDLDDVTSCLDDVGRESIVKLYLSGNSFTTLPEGVFQGLTGMTVLSLGDQLTTLPENILQDATGLTELWLGGNNFTSLPEITWQDLTKLTELSLSKNDFTTLPENMFQNLTGLTYLHLDGNYLTTLPEGVFQVLGDLHYLELSYNALTSLPEGVFQGLTDLALLFLDNNALTALPEGIFEDLTPLATLHLWRNNLVTLPEGVFQGLTTSLYGLWLYDNNLTTLPEGIFDGLTGLTGLNLGLNALECLPVIPVPLEERPTGIVINTDGLQVDPYGDECGCSIPDVTDNVCDQEFCTPGPVGYTCGGTLAPGAAPTVAPVSASLAPMPEPTLTSTAPASATPAPQVTSPAPTPSPSFGTTPGAPLSATPIVAGVVSAVAAAALVMLALCLRRRRASNHKIIHNYPPAVSSAHGDDNLERGREQPLDVRPTTSAMLAVGRGHGMSPAHMDRASPHHHTPAETDAGYGGVIVPPSASAPLDGRVQSSAEHLSSAVENLFSKAVEDQPPSHERNASSNHHTPTEPDAVNDERSVPPSAPEPLDGAAAASVESSGAEARGAEASGTDGGGAVALVVRDRDEKSLPHQDNTSPHRDIPAGADAVDGGCIVPPSAPAPLDGAAAGAATEDGGAGLAGEEDAAGGSAEKSLTTTSTATASTTDISTAEQEEVAQFRQRQRASEGALIAGRPTPAEEASGGCGTGASAAAARQNSAGDIGLGQAVLAAAQELARSCQIPGVSEAAGAVCIMANLFTDNRENDKASKSRLRQCRSIVLALRRADKVVGKGGEDTTGEAARILIEDVHDAIFDLVQLIKTFKSKNRLSKLLLSTLFKRRQDELDAVVNQAIMRLQLGLQLQAGHDMGSMKDSMKSMEDDVSAVKDGVKAVEEGMQISRQASIAEATSESVAESRRIRRQRKLDQVEIPEEQLFITTDLLGKGGFGEVYLADYNGHNAAAKVLHIAHDLGALDENQKQRESRQRRAFLRELEAMIRLRSPNTVNVFGAVTSLSDRMVLVMELLPNGDLLTLLRRSKKPLPEEQARRIIGDICAGMAFLHSKNTVHGDLKSANVLLDGDDRAKIGDFGTSRWSQHTNSTGLATYTTKANQSTQMSLAWSAPEVLESGGSSYKSDVYSFGIVVWEVISRELPWANKTRPRDILSAVLMGIRPSFHVDSPADIVDVAKACWGGEPEERTTFGAILEGLKANGWHE